MKISLQMRAKKPQTEDYRRARPNYWRNMDWLAVALFLILLACSLFILRSALISAEPADPSFYFRRQAQYMMIGMALLVFFMLFDYRKFRDYVRPAYVGICVLLLLTALVGTDVAGSKRWIFGFQPSELAKLLLIVVYAAYLEKNRAHLQEPKFIFKSMLIILVPMLLVLIEPDLGTSLVFFFFMLVMLFVAGANRKVMIGIVAGLVACVILIYVALYFYTDGFSHVLEERIPFIPLKTYQLMRLAIFVNPNMDAWGDGYHIIQSKVAIGSGGLFGQGYAQGSQVQGNFLPEHHTDFIFSVMGEEMGFFFCAAVLIVYCVFLLRLLQTAFISRDIFGTLIISGLCSVLIFQVLINVGMTMSIMPITGLTLPFFSYGITSLWVNMMAVGVIFGIRLRTPMPSLPPPE